MMEVERNLIVRAFSGAVVVDGLRIVAHPSGTLIARTPPAEFEQRRVAWQRLNELGPGVLDRENDWSDV